MFSIRRKMVRIRNDLLRLKTQLNTHTHISAMPSEILEEIFSQCMCQHIHRSTIIPFKCRNCDTGSLRLAVSTPHVPWRLTEVCTRCASLVNGSPRLWTHIPASHASWSIKEAMSRSAHMPLFVQMNLRSHEEHDIGERHKEAIKSMRSIFKRLHRIEDLTIHDWAEFLEKPLSKYEAYNAPLLRKLAVVNRGAFCGHISMAQDQFPIHITSLLSFVENPYLAGF